MRRTYIRVVYLGIAFLLVVAGWAARGMHAGKPAVPLPAAGPTVNPAKPESVVPAESAFQSLAALENQLKEQAKRLRALEETEAMSQRNPGQASAAVGLIVGEYIWTDLDGSKLLRYRGMDASGEPLTYLGYSGGVDLLASMAPDDIRDEIYKFGRPSADEVAKMLAKRGLIHPVVAQSRVVEQSGNRIFFETLDKVVNAGAPLMNSRGEAVAISESTDPDYPSFSMATLVASLKPWLSDALARRR